MLFSDEKIASYINQNFEPVWESVRPVPIVKIDFGNGQVITRTLHGNIATYLCTAHGTVLDILPGLYEPRAYLGKLDQLRLLSKYIEGQKQPAVALCDYHKQQADALSKNEPALTLAEVPDFRKILVEKPLKIVLSKPINSDASREGSGTVAAIHEKTNVPRDDLSVLLQDTALNETLRRQAIHARLAKAVTAQPAQLTKWLYKNVLHADLDDPFLGLGPTLFSTYPFKEDIPGGANKPTTSSL